MQLGDPLEQLFGLFRRKADTLDVLDAGAVFVDIILAELRDARVRPEQRQSHERARQPTPAINGR